MTSRDIEIYPILASDRSWVEELNSKLWGSSRIIAKGNIHDVNDLPGFIAVKDDRKIGLLTYSIADDQLEIVSLASVVQNIGVGTALISAALERAFETGCHRIWVITTNDNLPALGFYQRRGFQLVAVHRNALEDSRQLKPEIPLIGMEGIPLRDEIELEYRLNL